MSVNFDRQYRVSVSGPGGGFEFGGEQFPLHINFAFEKSDLNAPNNGNLSVWNLTPEHAKMLQDGEENATLTLRAGYGQKLFQIFSGIVNFSSTSMDGADWRTDIEVIDILEQHRDTYVSMAFAPGSSWEDIANAAAGQIGVPLELGHDVEFRNIDTGFSFCGYAEDILTKVSESNGLSWSVQDGSIQMKKSGDSMPGNRVYEISPDTGMIDDAVRVCIAGSAETGDKIIGYDVTCLLNGGIHVNDYVFLNSRRATGEFYVKSLQHTGDSMSGDWVTKLRLLERGKE